VFFGEREVATIPDVPRETPPIPINSAAVVGSGIMGGSIAMVLANAGIPVLLKEADHRGLGIVRSAYANSESFAVLRWASLQESRSQRVYRG
jgi:3-hydroxyacyl-CoA dehydrogenase